MKAKSFKDLLKSDDRVAVSNITGREASGVSVASQKYCGNIVAGWALGKGGQTIDVPGADNIPVYSTVEEMLTKLPKKKRPNKVIVYSPPTAVYGDVKSVVEHGKNVVETIYVITEHVSIEVTSKVAKLCSEANMDVLGCNCLGMINTHDAVRVGAVGGDRPGESFRPGTAAIISNSGNMVNTMASYLLSAGMGTSYGLSTGKDVLILTPLKEILELAREDPLVRMIVIYVEPGGLYEKQAVEMLSRTNYPKPIIAYVTGDILSKLDLSLGHAGAVVEGGETSAQAKMKLFDEYFGIEPFDRDAKYKNSAHLAEGLRKGIRIKTLHHLPGAAKLICDKLNIRRDFPPAMKLRLNPWFVDYKNFGKKLPSNLVLHRGAVPKPYKAQIQALSQETLGMNPARRDMRSASHASSNDGKVTRIHGYSLLEEMCRGSFARSLMLTWTGALIEDFEAELIEKCLIGSLTNGPGTISAQATKLSASAGNMPNTAMIATLACIGQVHGGNGRRAVDYLLKIFSGTDLKDPYDKKHGLDMPKLVREEVRRFSKLRNAAKEAGTDYQRIPCLGHPVFRNEPVNYDPRERTISKYLSDNNRYNIFLDFYHSLAGQLKEVGIARNVWAVNLDGAIASVILGACWKPLSEKKMTVARVRDIAFSVFAIGRAAGATGEYLDHQDYGTPMDMRVPISECNVLSRPKN